MKQDQLNYLIHVGFHKTGTSFLQKKIFNGKIKPFNPICDHNKAKAGAKYFGNIIIREIVRNIEPDILNIKKKLKESYLMTNKWNVISNEALSGPSKLSFTHKKQIALALAKIFPNAKIIIGIREQRSWIVSMYHQYLKMGGTLSPHNYFRLSNLTYFVNSFNSSHLCYDILISEYIRLFGRENVWVYLHEELTMRSHEFIKELSAFLDEPIFIEESIFSKKVNVKYKLGCLELSRFLSSFLYHTEGNCFSSIGILRSKDKREKFLSITNKCIPDSINRRLQYRLFNNLPTENYSDYVSSNRKLSKIINKNLEEYGYMI